MGNDLLRVDWNRLTHAYGWASDVPQMLINIASPDETARKAGWEGLWGAVNHQGDYYDSTVATIPFLIQAAASARFADRVGILGYFRGRWLEAAEYGGDPMLADPPGGQDEPTPMLTDEQLAARMQEPMLPAKSSGDDFDIESYRRMDLCAWQTGRAIQAGQATYERLLDDPDRAVAAAAASLLLLWPQTRTAGKRTLARLIADEPDPVAQGSRVLELAMYASRNDLALFADWVAPGQAIELRAAAALGWAWAITPEELPAPAAQALAEAAAPDCKVFGKLPWVGVYHRGPWILPSSAAGVLLKLAENRDDELRWRAVQGLAPGRESARHLAQDTVVRVLAGKLSDQSQLVREAAALALVQRGLAVFDLAGNLAPVLMQALDDASPSVCGHAARLLALVSERLSAAERKEAAAAADKAAKRFASRGNAYVQFESLGVQAASARTGELPAGAAALTRLLADESDSLVGVTGRFDFDGRVYHWRQVRRSPRAAAIHALFQLGHIPPGPALLQAMLAAARQSSIVCGRHAAPFRFEMAQWQAAIDAAGGLPEAEPAIRSARQASRSAAWQGEQADDLAFAAEAELAAVLRRLSGRVTA